MLLLVAGRPCPGDKPQTIGYSAGSNLTEGKHFSGNIVEVATAETLDHDPDLLPDLGRGGEIDRDCP